ncbi:hypothetical protein EJ110_NYTH15471 [Nymphaea thermarum]|nr:hypothetical protein EJ110_NYTH15471 [Nymphaea thermarum]
MMHFKEEALHWFQWINEREPNQMWDQFRAELIERFEKSSYRDFNVQLKNLRQTRTGSGRNYISSLPYWRLVKTRSSSLKSSCNELENNSSLSSSKKIRASKLAQKQSIGCTLDGESPSLAGLHCQAGWPAGRPAASDGKSLVAGRIILSGEQFYASKIVYIAKPPAISQLGCLIDRLGLRVASIRTNLVAGALTRENQKHVESRRAGEISPARFKTCKNI